MEKKCIVIGITGGIAAYKAASLVSSLKKKGHDVHVIMTKNACEFITPLTLETLSQNKVSVDTFDRNFEYNVHHISLAKKADVFAIVPATANVIAKIVHGIADDMLTTTFLASSCPKIICPAMNTGMLENEITQNNLKLCKSLGYTLVESASGILACGDTGAGRLCEIEDIEEAIQIACCTDKILKNKKVLISAGSTMEKIDPVRFIRNHSTGKMGYALAKQARNLGADVTIISGVSELPTPYLVQVKKVQSAQEMFEAFKECYEEYDIIIKAAAVSDFTPETYQNQKIKKGSSSMQLSLSSTQDICKWLGAHKRENQFLCAFAMETENCIENAKKKLQTKNANMIVANSLNDKGAGFGVDTNVATIITKNRQFEYELMSKEELAKNILTLISEESKCY